MANVEVKQEGTTKVILTVTVPTDELKPFLEEAAQKVSKERKIKGFRPGKAPYEEVVKEVGDMAVHEAALNTIVRKTFVKAVLENELETIGAPEINITTLAPGNDLVYEATVTLVPKIKKLAEWKSLSVKTEPVSVTDKEVDQALKDLSGMQTKEMRAGKDEAVGKKDKVVVDLDMKKEGVPVEGGLSKGSFVFMNQESYLPGLQEAILGMKEEEKKTFEITFPEDHFQKHLAGAKVNVDASVKEIFHLEIPELDDAFAKQLGLESFEDLKKKLNENIGGEKEREANMKLERKVLDEVAEKSEFEEIPEALIDNETNKMLQELHHQINSQGLEFEQYLSSIKRSVEELQKEFKPQALRRLEIALILKEIAKEEKIEADEKELNKLIEEASKDIKDEETKKRVLSQEYREYQANILRNRDVIALLKKTIVK